MNSSTVLVTNIKHRCKAVRTPFKTALVCEPFRIAPRHDVVLEALELVVSILNAVLEPGQILDCIKVHLIRIHEPNGNWRTSTSKGLKMTGASP